MADNLWRLRSFVVRCHNNAQSRTKRCGRRCDISAWSSYNRLFFGCLHCLFYLPTPIQRYVLRLRRRSLLLVRARLKDSILFNPTILLAMPPVWLTWSLSLFLTFVICRLWHLCASSIGSSATSDILSGTICLAPGSHIQSYRAYWEWPCIFLSRLHVSRPCAVQKVQQTPGLTSSVTKRLFRSFFALSGSQSIPRKLCKKESAQKRWIIMMLCSMIVLSLDWQGIWSDLIWLLGVESWLRDHNICHPFPLSTYPVCIIARISNVASCLSPEISPSDSWLGL